MSDSPFKKISPNITHDITRTAVTTPGGTFGTIDVTPTSPLSRIQNTAVTQMPTTDLMVIDDQEIEQFGSQSITRVGETTTRITQSMTLDKFDDLGGLVADMELQVRELDPNTAFSGIGGWFRKEFLGAKKVLMVKYQKAESAFDAIQKRIAENITQHEQWITNLGKMYQENYASYLAIKADYERGLEREQFMVKQLAAMPLVDDKDPDAVMKMQARQIQENRINRMRVRLDVLLKNKMVTEDNGPQFMAQIATSRTTIDTLRALLETIPELKRKFVMFVHSMSTQKSLNVVRQGREIVNQGMIRGAEAAGKAATEAAQLGNSSTIKDETIIQVRDRTFQMLADIRRINQEGVTARANSRISLENNRSENLKKLTGDSKSLTSIGN